MEKIFLWLLIILLSLNITLAEDSFNLKVELPDEYKVIFQGEELIASIKLLNLGANERVDIFLDYWVSDVNKNVIIKKKETVAVETQANFVKSFNLPEDIKPGKYVIHAKVTYFDGKAVEAEDSFEIANKTVDRLFFVAPSILILALLVYLVYKSKFWIQKLQIKYKVDSIVKERNLNK